MKRKILVLLIAFMFLFTVTGCKENKVGKKDDRKSIVLNDTTYGFKTTFKYQKDEKYEVKEVSGGKYKEIEIENKKNNLEFDIYYFEMLDSSYDSSKKTRKESEGYKEYKWGNFEGYIYNVSDHSLNFNILLRKGTKDKSLVGIFGEVSSIDYKGTDVLTSFNNKEIQDLLNSIKFEEK